MKIFIAALFLLVANRVNAQPLCAENLAVDGCNNGTGGTTGSTGPTGATGPTGSITVTGSDTQVLFNDAGAVGADSGMTYNKSTDKLTLLGNLTTNGPICTVGSGSNATNTLTLGALGAGISHSELNILGDSPTLKMKADGGSGDDATIEYTNLLGGAFLIQMEPAGVSGLTLDGVTGAPTVRSPITVDNGGTASEIRLREPLGSGSNYTGIKTQAQAADLTYTLPGTSVVGELHNDGAGALSWTASSAGTVTTLTANTPLTSIHRGLILCNVTGGDVTLTLPPVATSTGWRFLVKTIRASGTSLCNIVPTSGEVIENAAASAGINAGPNIGTAFDLMSDGAIWRLATGSRKATHVNVLDFGATPDDTTDDTVAIQAAIDALPTGFVDGSSSSFRGGTVFVPAGRYRIGGTSGHCTSSSPANKVCTSDADCTGGTAAGYCCALNSHGHALKMMGAGSFSSEILMYGNNTLNGVCINPKDNQSSLSDMRIAKPNNPKVGTGHGVIIQGQRTRLRDLNVDRWGGHCYLFDGEQSVAQTNSDRLDRTSAGGCGGDGYFIWSHNDSSIHTITNSEAEGNGGYGFHLISSKNVIKGVQSNGNTLGGMYIEQGSGNEISQYCETATQPFCIKIAAGFDGNTYFDLSASLDTAGQLVDDGINNEFVTRGRYRSVAYKRLSVAPYTCDTTSAINTRGQTYYDLETGKVCRCDAFDAGNPFPDPMWCPIETPVSTACLGGTTTDCGTEASASGTSISDVQLPQQDLPAATASIWQIGGHSRDQLLGIDKLSNIALKTYSNADCLVGTNNPIAGCTGVGTGNIVALDNAVRPFSGSNIFTAAVIAATTDHIVIEATATTGVLPTDVVSAIGSWFTSAQWREPPGNYPRSVTVQANYSGAPGTWTTIASTTTAPSFWRSLATFTGMSGTGPYDITGIRWTFTDFVGTGDVRLLTVGLHHRSETPFPQYLSRVGSTRGQMRAGIGWDDKLGSIVHVQGPTDQPFKVASGTGQKLLLNGSEVCRDLVTNTTSVGNIGAGEDNLMTYTIPAATLGTDGNRVEFKTAGTVVNNANTKQIRVKFGATTILDTGSSLPANAAYSWTVNVECIRTGATTQKCSATLVTSSSTFVSQTGYSTATETLSGTIIFKLTGQATSDNDIVEETEHVNYCPGA